MPPCTLVQSSFVAQAWLPSASCEQRTRPVAVGLEALHRGDPPLEHLDDLEHLDLARPDDRGDSRRGRPAARRSTRPPSASRRGARGRRGAGSRPRQARPAARADRRRRARARPAAAPRTRLSSRTASPQILARRSVMAPRNRADPRSIAGWACSAVSWMRCLSRRHGLIVTPLAAACRARPRTVSPSSRFRGQLDQELEVAVLALRGGVVGGEPLEQLDRGLVLLEDHRDEVRDALLAGALDELLEQRGGDAASLPVVDHRDGDLGDRRVGRAHVAGDARRARRSRRRRRRSPRGWSGRPRSGT